MCTFKKQLMLLTQYHNILHMFVSSQTSVEVNVPLTNILSFCHKFICNRKDTLSHDAGWLLWQNVKEKEMTKQSKEKEEHKEEKKPK